MGHSIDRGKTPSAIWFPERPNYEHLGSEAMEVLDDFAWTIYCLRDEGDEEENALPSSPRVPARCPRCGRQYVQQWQNVWVTWDCEVVDGFVEFSRDHEIKDVVGSASYFRCGSCDKRGFNEEEIVAASN